MSLQPSMRIAALLCMAALVAWLAGCSSAPKPAPKGADGYSKYGNPNSYEVLGERYEVMRSNRGYKETGIASWYGPGFHGKRASAGETYDQNAMTAAHKTLRIPCYVEVTNLENGRKAVVRVNDRGPFHENRVIDLSKAAADKLGVVGKGTAMVEVRHLDEYAPGAAPAERSNEQFREPPLSETLVAMSQPEPAPLAADPVARPAAAAIAPLASRPVPEWGRNIYVQLGAFSLRPNAEQLRSKLEIANISGVNVVQRDDGLFRVRIGPLSSVDDADALAAKLDAAGVYGRHMVVE
ncbi:MAG: septal ring lytic transglycosylase RlpA family protein [Pseudomonadota bacterium]